jgi:anti-sigma regulatory factor (Ser/Thr protein kinase)
MTTTDAGARTGLSFAQAFPGSPEQVGNVRRAIRFYLGSCPASDDVTLIGSELATNAIVHSRSGHGGTFTVRAELHPTWVWIEVEDAGGEWADQGHTDRPHGLAIVSELAREWGRTDRPHGRTVWARVDFQAPRSRTAS